VRDLLTAEDVLRWIKVVLERNVTKVHKTAVPAGEVTLIGFWEIKGAFGIRTHWQNH